MASHQRYKERVPIWLLILLTITLFKKYLLPLKYSAEVGIINIFGKIWGWEGKAEKSVLGVRVSVGRYGNIVIVCPSNQVTMIEWVCTKWSWLRMYSVLEFFYVYCLCEVGGTLCTVITVVTGTGSLLAKLVVFEWTRSITAAATVYLLCLSTHWRFLYAVDCYIHGDIWHFAPIEPSPWSHCYR